MHGSSNPASNAILVKPSSHTTLDWIAHGALQPATGPVAQMGEAQPTAGSMVQFTQSSCRAVSVLAEASGVWAAPVSQPVAVA